MLRHIQNSLREAVRDDATRVGPFLVRLDADSDDVYSNYAVPEADAEPTDADVAELVALFRDEGRVPRLEYVRPVPALDAALERAGFTVERAYPVLAVEPGDLRVPDVPDGVELVEPVTDDELVAATDVQNAAFGVGSLVREAAIRRQRSMSSKGAVLLMALVDGVPAGAGLATAPEDGLAQVAGIGVLEEFRGRGIGKLITARLSERVFAAGHRPFLETEADHKVDRVYGPLGYRVVGHSAGVSLT
ncbi:hypothetical protein SUDANB95_05388 [Actinosynnema sp. ALI-1.44]